MRHIRRVVGLLQAKSELDSERVQVGRAPLLRLSDR